MNIIKDNGSNKVIPIEHFKICLVDSLTEQDIRNKYNRRAYGSYFLQKLEYHLKTVHKINLKEYIQKYLCIDWPKCPITGLDVNCKYRSNNELTFNNFHKTAKQTKENSAKVRAACERISKERMGSGNPMFGKVAWNKGLDVSHPIIKKIAEDRIGTKMSEDSKAKMRQRRADSPIKARHTTPHSPETIRVMRENTAKSWANGSFNRVTSIHIKTREFLKTLNLVDQPTEEYQVKYFALDFAFINAKIGVECQGTYFHIDPRIYPNGPTNAMQRRNFGRDKAKKAYLSKLGWKIIEIWETEINDGSFKNDLLCKFKELNLLKI